MLKTSVSFVLGSSKSSTYPRGYASGFDSPAALLDSRFEHPVSWKASVLLLVAVLSQSWLPVFAQSNAEKTSLLPPQDVRVFDTPSDGGSSLTVLWSPSPYDSAAARYQILFSEGTTVPDPA